MKTYNYLEAVKYDVLDYINGNGITVNSENRDEIEEQLNEDLLCCDSVTGNASGSYTFNAWEAEENLCHNLDLLGGGLRGVRLKHGYFERRCRGVRCYDTLLPA